MKHQDSNFSSHKFQPPTKAPKKLVLIITSLVFILTLIPSAHKRLVLPAVYHDLNTSEGRDSALREINGGDERCDLFSGEWVWNSEGPYYSNFSCGVIQEQQNCLKFGRPDRDFMKWRWKPDGCDLPIFDPYDFLEMMRGKSLGFVGDSVARNHMQSLICLLSRVVHPVNITAPTQENELSRFYTYPDYSFNISFLSSQYLVRTERRDSVDISRPFNLYLDEFDESWTSKVSTLDYIIISGGPWFFRPAYFYLNRTLVGCLYCSEPNVTQRSLYFSYRWAFKTAFRAINGARGFKGVVFVRTFSPSHFEGGDWDKGGDCMRTAPVRRNETALQYYTLDMYKVQVEEARNAGRRFRVLDVTRPMLVRPDGHPGRYGRWAVANRTVSNDCVHWCLPGPIDAWNDFLMHMLKNEV